jgi:hypothetical protein
LGQILPDEFAARCALVKLTLPLAMLLQVDQENKLWIHHVASPENR